MCFRGIGELLKLERSRFIKGWGQKVMTVILLHFSWDMMISGIDKKLKIWTLGKETLVGLKKPVELCQAHKAKVVLETWRPRSW